MKVLTLNDVTFKQHVTIEILSAYLEVVFFYLSNAIAQKFSNLTPFNIM